MTWNKQQSNEYVDNDTVFNSFEEIICHFFFELLNSWNAGNLIDFLVTTIGIDLATFSDFS